MSKNNTLESEQLTDAMYYILLSLVEERHGYAIMKFIEEITKGHVKMGPGTLYTLLKKLDQAGWIQQVSTCEERTKTYLITALGMGILHKEFERRCFMVEEGKRILKEAKYEK